MTVAVQSPRARFLADGATVAFPISFTVQTGADLRVWIAADAAAPAVETGDWSYAAGVLTLFAPPPAGSVVAIERHGALHQTWAPVVGAPVPPAGASAAVDALARQIQDLAARLSRSLVLDPTANGPAPTLGQPLARGVLFADAAGERIYFDNDLGPALLAAHAEALAAAAAARADALAAAASKVAAQVSAVNAAAHADRAQTYADRAEAAADRADAAKLVVLEAAQRASWALGLMGLANNMTQLLYVVTPFLGRLFGIWKDFGWVNMGVAVTVDLGWVCPPAVGGDCENWGLITAAATTSAEWGDLTAAADPAEEWGLVLVRAICVAPVICAEDLGWINAVIDVSSTQPIELPVRVPDPCLLITRVPGPVDPDPDQPPTPIVGGCP